MPLPRDITGYLKGSAGTAIPGLGRSITRSHGKSNVGPNTGTPWPSDIGAFSGAITYDGSGVTWSYVQRATTDANTIEPTVTGWYSCDATWVIEGGTPDATVAVSIGGAPYHGGQPGGFASLILDGSGYGIVSAHWQGVLAPGFGLAVGGAEFFTAQVIGRCEQKVNL